MSFFNQQSTTTATDIVLSHDEKARRYRDIRANGLTVEDAVKFPAYFTEISENRWIGMGRVTEKLDDFQICDGAHNGFCNTEGCVGWECMIECRQHVHGVDCKGMNFRRSVGALLKLYQVGDEFGVFTVEGAQKDAFLCEFVGNVVWASELDKNNPYYVVLDSELLLDCSKYGGIASFVNHSCSPNCSLQIWSVPCGDEYESRVGLFALRELNPGEPLFYDARMPNFIASTMKCYCGRTLCRVYANTDRHRKPLKKITRWRANAVVQTMNEASRIREQIDEGVRAIGPEGEYDGYRSELIQSAEYFRYVDVSSLKTDVVSVVNDALQKHGKLYRDEVAVLECKHTEHGWEMTMKVCNVPFTAVAPKKNECKLRCLKKAITLFQSIPAEAIAASTIHDVVVPRNIVSHEGPATSSSKRDIKSVVQTIWALVSTFKNDIERVKTQYAAMESTSATRQQKLVEEGNIKKMLLLSVNEMFPTPMEFMQLLGINTFKIHDLIDCAALHIHNRKKKAEVGSHARMHTVYNEVMAVKNPKYGTFLLLVGKVYSSHSLGTLLEELQVSVEDVVDKNLYEAAYSQELTVENLYLGITSALQRNRSPLVYGAKIRSVIWPMQSLADMYESLGVLENHLSSSTSKDCMMRLRQQVLGENFVKVPGIHMNVAATDENWSSMVIATQMQMTEVQYKEKVEDSMRYSHMFKTAGFAWMSLRPEDCHQIRSIVLKWIEMMNTDMSHVGNLKGYRNIGSWVDEYALFPGGTSQYRTTALQSFLSRLCRIGFGEVELLKTLVDFPKKGLSPIARTEAGACFRQMELCLVLAGEKRTGERSLTVCPHAALGAHPRTSPQPPHLDDQRLETMAAVLPLNLPNEGNFRATLVPKLDLDFATLYSDTSAPKNAAKFSDTFIDVYTPLINLTPDKFLNAMQPAVDSFDNSGMLVTLGNELHAGPGNNAPNASGLRLVLFAASGREGMHYDGEQQMMWDQMIEQKHGNLCFWVLLHVSEFSLCDGIHVAGHYDRVQLPISQQEWKSSKILGQKWSRENFLHALVAAIRYLCSPKTISLSEWPLIGEPTRNRKRALRTNEPRNEYGNARYNRMQVRRSMTVLWRYMSVGELYSERVITRFMKRIQCEDIVLEKWSAWGELKRLRQVFQIMFPAPDDTCKAKDSYQFVEIREATKATIGSTLWSTYTNEMEDTVSKATPFTDVELKIMQTQAEGYRPNSFVTFEHNGVQMRGIICGYDSAGNVEVTIAMPSTTEIVVKKSKLTLVYE